MAADLSDTISRQIMLTTIRRSCCAGGSAGGAPLTRSCQEGTPQCSTSPASCRCLCMARRISICPPGTHTVRGEHPFARAAHHQLQDQQPPSDDVNAHTRQTVRRCCSAHGGADRPRRGLEPRAKAAGARRLRALRARARALQRGAVRRAHLRRRRKQHPGGAASVTYVNICSSSPLHPANLLGVEACMLSW